MAASTFSNKRLAWMVIAFIGVFPLPIILFNSNEKANLQSRLGRFILNSTLVERGREERQQGLEQQKITEPVGVPPICPQGVPPVDVSLANTDLIRDCLDPDFAPWENFTFGMAALQATVERRYIRKDVVALVQIKNNQLTFLDRDDDCSNNCNGMLISIRENLRRGLALGKLSLPDCAFVLNVFDEPLCSNGAGNECLAPVFSLLRINTHYKDILMPAFHPSFEVNEYPWELKEPIAFFRGTPFCSGSPHFIDHGGPKERQVNCSRLVLSELSDQYPELLNVSINLNFSSNGYTWVAKNPGMTVPHSEHAKYQMLLNLDGFSASRRLGILLGMNSVVLKQASLFEEHYYRALRPCEHYLPFWKESEEDVLDLIRAIQKDPETAQKIAANAQAFAKAHLTDEARWQYWEAMLHRYAKLFRDS